MSRGGYRAGAGRPKGGKEPSPLVGPVDVRLAARKAGVTPLEYMLAVMNDEAADDTRRDRMAIAAAPYAHPRADVKPAGKKDLAIEAARTAGDGTEWGDDLAGPDARLN